MNINEYMEKHREVDEDAQKIIGRSWLKLRPRIVCKDGFKMSVQASATHYCTPRNNDGPYTEVEVGYPTEEEELLLPYVEYPEKPTDSVYGYVPVEIVDKVIEKHGGIK